MRVFGVREVMAERADTGIAAAAVAIVGVEVVVVVRWLRHGFPRGEGVEVVGGADTVF